jgi:hypothetical protein
MIETPLQTGLSRLVVSTLGVARHCRAQCKACVKQGVVWRGKYLAVSAGWRSKKQFIPPPLLLYFSLSRPLKHVGSFSTAC